MPSLIRVDAALIGTGQATPALAVALAQHGADESAPITALGEEFLVAQHVRHQNLPQVAIAQSRGWRRASRPQRDRPVDHVCVRWRAEEGLAGARSRYGAGVCAGVWRSPSG